MEHITQLNAELQSASAEREAASQALNAARDAVTEARKKVDAMHELQKPDRDALAKISTERKELRAEMSKIHEEINEQRAVQKKIWADFQARSEDWVKRRDAAREIARAEHKARQEERYK